MSTLWLRLLAFFGDREARKRLRRSEGSRRAWQTRKRRSMAVKVGEPQPPVTSASITWPPPARNNAAGRPIVDGTMDPRD